jgi:hypothetical protein
MTCFEHKFNEPSPGRACLPKEPPMRAKAALQRHPLQPGGPLAVAVLEDDQLLAHTHLRELGGADLRSLMSVFRCQSASFMVPRPGQPAS